MTICIAYTRCGPRQQEDNAADTVPTAMSVVVLTVPLPFFSYSHVPRSPPISRPYFALATISNLICAFLFIHKPTRRGSRMHNFSATSLGEAGAALAPSSAPAAPAPTATPHPVRGTRILLQAAATATVIPLERQVTSVVLRHRRQRLNLTRVLAQSSWHSIGATH